MDVKLDSNKPWITTHPKKINYSDSAATGYVDVKTGLSIFIDYTYFNDLRTPTIDEEYPHRGLTLPLPFSLQKRIFHNFQNLLSSKTTDDSIIFLRENYIYFYNARTRSGFVLEWLNSEWLGSQLHCKSLGSDYKGTLIHMEKFLDQLKEEIDEYYNKRTSEIKNVLIYNQ